MIEKLAELLNVAQITDDYRGYPDLEISAWNTADGYELTVMTNDHKNIDWEYDVYYYEPDFDTIIDRIKETVDTIGGGEAIIYVDDIESRLPEYEVNEYIEQYADDK